MDRRLFYFLSVVVYEMIGLFIDLKKDSFTGLIRRHGFVRKEEFILEEVNDNSVTFSIKPNAEMLDNYLYQFELRVVYTLNGKSIRTEFQVTNLEMEKQCLTLLEPIQHSIVL